MGTSSSSSGSPSGTPMVPSWASDPVQPSGSELDSDNVGIPDGGITDQIAPRARFYGARRSLGSFSRTRSANDMRKGVAHYFAKGLGGGSMAVRRFRGTVRTAGTLFGALSAASVGQASGPNDELDPNVLSGSSVDTIVGAIVEAVRPIDGTLDGEASRIAIEKSLSDLLTCFQDADLLNLSEKQRIFVVERYVAWDVFNRFSLDLGKTIQEKSSSAMSALSCLREARDFIAETIAAEFRNLATGADLISSNVARIVRETLQSAIMVFDEYR